LPLHDYLEQRGVRAQCDITLVMPFGSPVPPSPDTSKALVAAFAERNITFLPNRKVTALSAPRRMAVLDDGSELPYDLFLGIPKHVAPAVVQASGLTENGWIGEPADPGDSPSRGVRDQ
jgi:sulfide:quinone oxidoreductase